MTYILVVAIIAILAIGMPVAFGIGLVSALWMLFVNDLGWVTLAQRVYYSLDSFSLVSIPLFVIIGVLAERTGMLPELVRWLQMLIGSVRGGLAYITIASSYLLSGISGTATADIASLGRIHIQMLRQAGYSMSYSAALTASASMLGPIIPPSVVMIVYATSVGNVSISGLFLAGMVPGTILAIGLGVMSWFKARQTDGLDRGERFGLGQIARQTIKVIPLLILPLIIVGGTVSGVFTVTESAAVGVVYTVIIGMFTKPRLTFRDIYESVIYSAKISSVAGLLMATGALLTYIFSINMVTASLATFLTGISTDPTVFMLIVTVALLVIGMFLDSIPITVALAPLLATVATQYGIPDFQFAMVFLMAALIGIITPPVGMILFMTSSISKLSVERLSVAILPFVVMMIGVVILLAIFPALSTFVPALFGLR